MYVIAVSIREEREEKIYNNQKFNFPNLMKTTKFLRCSQTPSTINIKKTTLDISKSNSLKLVRENLKNSEKRFTICTEE